MSDDLSFQKSVAGWAIVKTEYSGRFPGNGRTIEFDFGEAEKCCVKIICDETENEFFIENTEAEDFLMQIIYLGRKPEIRSESNWSRSIRVKAEWEIPAFAVEPSGKISEVSYEWTIEEMEEYLPTIKDAEIAADIKATLVKGLHRRAIEMHLETEKFVKRLLNIK